MLEIFALEKYFLTTQENLSTNDPTNTQKSVKAGNDSGIDIDLDVVTREIKDQVEILLDEKLSDLGIQTSKVKYHSMSENQTEEKISGGILRGNMTLGNTRELNIIVHGINENTEADETYIKKLFDIMEMDTGPTIAHRLGVKKEDRARPIRIVMK